MLEDLLVAQQGGESWQRWTLKLPDVLNIVNPATPYGFVGAPAVLYPDNYQEQDYDATKNTIFVASANGYVAAINPLFCFNNMTKGSRISSEAREEPLRRLSRLRGAAANAAAAAAATAAAAAELSAPSTLPPVRRSLSGEAPTSDAPNGAVWAVYKNVNVMYACPEPGCTINSGTFATWPECQAACWADLAASGGLGDPTGCIAWVWHDTTAEPAFVHKCLFGRAFDAFANVRPQGGHVSGVLTTPDVPGPACIVWSRPIAADGSKPSYSSVRVVKVNGQAVVLVSETDPNLNTGGVLHALDAATGAELWHHDAVLNAVSYGLKGVVPAQAPPVVDSAGRYLLVAYGSKLAVLDMMMCAASGGACAEIAAFDTAGVPGGGDLIVSSPAVYPAAGNRIFFHSSTGTLWKVSWVWVANEPPTFSYDGSVSGWACRYTRSNQSTCVPAAETVRGADGAQRPVREYGTAGGWYQPTTRAERDELHAEIRLRHAARFGAARGVPTSEAERADAVSHVARLARELPPAELFSIVTPSGYRRLGPSGRPAPTPAVRDFGGLFPFASPAIYNDGFQDASVIVATVDYRLDQDSGLYVVDEHDGSPLRIPNSTRTFSIYYGVLADGRKVPLGRSRSSPAFDRQRHVYVGFDLDFDGMYTAHTRDFHRPPPPDTFSPYLYFVPGVSIATRTPEP